jgi:hypothetical protein
MPTQPVPGSGMMGGGAGMAPPRRASGGFDAFPAAVSRSPSSTSSVASAAPPSLRRASAGFDAFPSSAAAMGMFGMRPMAHNVGYGY